MRVEFSGENVSDGQILRIDIARNELRLELRDWEGKCKILTFLHVLAIESIGITNADLSHAATLENDEFMKRACLQAGESEGDYRCFALFSAWGEGPILRIVARSY